VHVGAQPSSLSQKGSGCALSNKPTSAPNKARASERTHEHASERVHA
jgi:hypothetical protein